jgi:hypothetical protein
MTHEEMQRSMEFVLEQQAKFAADMQQLSSFGSRLTRAQIRAQKETDAKFAELTDAHKKTEAAVAELANAQTRTEERLGTFVTFVERYLSGNGREQKLQ